MYDILASQNQIVPNNTFGTGLFNACGHVNLYTLLFGSILGNFLLSTERDPLLGRKVNNTLCINLGISFITLKYKTIHNQLKV